MSRCVLTWICFVTVAHAAQGEEVDSPIYKSWAQFKPGAVVVLREVTEAEGGGRVVTTKRRTLRTLDEQKAVVEEVIESDATGRDVESEPQEYTHRRAFPLLPGVKREEIGRPQGAEKQGAEKLEVVGKTYETRWYDTKGQTEAGPSFVRAWYSDEVPGLLVKSVTRVPAVHKSTTLTIVELKPQ